MARKVVDRKATLKAQEAKLQAQIDALLKKQRANAADQRQLEKEKRDRECYALGKVAQDAGLDMDKLKALLAAQTMEVK